MSLFYKPDIPAQTCLKNIVFITEPGNTRNILFPLHHEYSLYQRSSASSLSQWKGAQYIKNLPMLQRHPIN